MRNHVRFDKETGKFYQGKVKRSLKNGWYLSIYSGVEQLVACRAHNPEVVGSSPSSATIKKFDKIIKISYNVFVKKMRRKEFNYVPVYLFLS